jgi:hypothetical protein
MKGFTLAAAVLGIAILAVLPSLAGGSTSDVRVTCKTGSIDVYFWPHGHPKVPAYKFSKDPAPHLEVYRRGTPASRNLFIVVSAAKFSYANTCDLATDPRPTAWGGGPRATVSAARRVRCRFPSVVQVKFGPGRLAVVRGSTAREILTASIKAKGSTLTYDSRYCNASRVPGVG